MTDEILYRNTVGVDIEYGDVRPGMPGTIHPNRLTCDIKVLDKSGSMENEGFETGKSKLDLLYEACSRLVEVKRRHRPNDMVAVLSFDHAARVCCPPMNVFSGYDALMRGIRLALSPPHGGTDISQGLECARALLEQYGFLSPESPFFCRVLLFSDGYSSNKSQALAAAQALKNAHVLVETLGLGRHPNDVDEPLLKGCATTDAAGTHYRFLGSADELFLTFENAATSFLVWEG